MKKVTFLLATLLIGGMMLTGCKKDPQPTPTPEPEPTTNKVAYKLDKVGIQHTASDCFKYTVSYLGADGQTVTVNDVTLPWTSPEFTVNLPFTFKIEGDATYNEAELPDPVNYGCVFIPLKNGSVCSPTMGGTASSTKEDFINMIAGEPDLLKFSYSTTIQASQEK